MQLTDDIKGLIERHLPATAGGLIAERLTLCDALEVKGRKDARIIEDMTVTIEKLTARESLANTKIGTADRRLAELDLRERAIVSRESKMELNEYKVKAADDKVAVALEVTRAVFANNRFKYQTSESGQIPAGQFGTTFASSTKNAEGES